MRQLVRLIIMHSVLGASLFAASLAYGGPSYNAVREALDKDSREGGARLNHALELTHKMFRFVEDRNMKGVEPTKSEALAQLTSALASFRRVESNAPKQKLVLNPSSADDKNAMEEFVSMLKAEKIEYPDTEAKLANIAVVLVERHIQVLKETKIDGSKADLQRIRKLIKSQAVVMQLGILTSIAWSIAPP